MPTWGLGSRGRGTLLGGAQRAILEPPRPALHTEPTWGSDQDFGEASWGSRSTQTPLTPHRRLTKSTLLLIPLFGVHYVVFALFPEHVGVDARLYFELVLGSYQVRWAGEAPVVPPQTPPGAPGMWGFGLFWEKVSPNPWGRARGLGLENLALISSALEGVRAVGGGKGREKRSTEGSGPFLWVKIALPVLSRASWWLCSTVSSMGR